MHGIKLFDFLDVKAIQCYCVKAFLLVLQLSIDIVT